jgi:DNA-binding transcriptional LysR family regulator
MIFMRDAYSDPFAPETRMQIDLRLLRHAQALAEHVSFTRAAEALDITQPSLSRGIKELETRVGLPLFNRSRAGHEPTDFGRVFLQHAAEVMRGVGDLEREVALAKGLASGEVSVGMGPYAAECLLPRCGARFSAAHPAVRLRVSMGDPALMARLLRSRAVDIAVAEATVLEDEVSFEVVGRLDPVEGFALVRAGHPLTRRAPPEIGDLLDYPFAQVVMLPPRLLKPILATRRAPLSGPAMPFPAIECPTADIACRIVAESDAFTFGSLGMVRDDLELGRLVPVLHSPWLRAEWAVVRLRNRTLSPAMSAFLEQLQQTHAALVRDEKSLRERFFDSRHGSPTPRPRSPAAGTGPTPAAARQRSSTRKQRPQRPARG